MRGFNPRAPVDEAPAPCYPSRLTDACLVCARRKLGSPPWDRQFVVIDASVTLRDGVCHLFEARPVVKAFAEADHA